MTNEIIKAKQKKNGGAKPKKTILLSVIAVSLVALVASVVFLSSGASKDASDKKDGGNLTIGLKLEPTNLNIKQTAGAALDQILIDNVYEGLIALQPGKINEFKPALAESLPEISDGGKTYTFKLRKNVKFHDGSDLTAEDVVSSLQEGLKKPLAKNPFSVESTAEKIQIKLTSPDSTLEWLLTGRAGLVFSKSHAGNMENSANGTGPFKLTEWRKADSVTLVKNPAYYGEKAHLNTAVFRFIKDDQARANALRDGSIDVDNVLASNLNKSFANDKNIQVTRGASTDVITLAYNTSKAPFNDPRVRAAISEAIDTNSLISAVNGDGKPLGSPITELEPGYADLTGMHAYNPTHAKQLLADAGKTNMSLTITVPNVYDAAVTNIIVSQLHEIGVQAKVEQVEFSKWLDQVYKKKDYDISFVNHVEARDFEHYANPDYYFGYNSQKVQELYKNALLATDSKTADDYLRQAARTVAEDAPAKWLYNYTSTIALNTRVDGFSVANAHSRIPLAKVSIK